MDVTPLTLLASFTNAGAADLVTVRAVRRQLKPLEVEFLTEVVQRRSSDPSLMDALRRDQLTDDEADALLDLVTDELAERGFDDRYEPTPHGRRLEDMIDVLNEE